jgi:Xaa-Pro aminopeptidase
MPAKSLGLVPGLTENEVATVLDNSLLSIGFSLFFSIVLFEENGALPHGGFITGEKVLEEDSMVLIDVGYVFLALIYYLIQSYLSKD